MNAFQRFVARALGRPGTLSGAGSSAVDPAGSVRTTGSVAAIRIRVAEDPPGLTYQSPLERFAREFKADYTRTTEDNGATAVLRLLLPNGDVITARGRTTAEAELELRVRAEPFRPKPVKS